jgi:hypothetical protein
MLPRRAKSDLNSERGFGPLLIELELSTRHWWPFAVWAVIMGRWN